MSIETKPSNSYFSGPFGFSLLAYLCLIVMAPLSTYAAFYQHLDISFLLLALSLVCIAVVAALLTAIVGRFSPEPIKSFFRIAAVLLVLAVFYNFYSNDYRGKVIGADKDVFAQDYSSLELAVFTLVFGLAIFYRRQLKPHLARILLFVLLISFGNLSPLLSATEESADIGSQNPLDSREFLGFSSSRNVIHIVLDGMQGTFFSRMLSEEPELKPAFEGFVFFPDTLTATEITYLAIASMYTARAFDGSTAISEYQRASLMRKPKANSDLPGTNFLLDLAKAAFQIHILAANGSEMQRQDFYNEYYYADLLDDRKDPNAGVKRLLDLTLVKTLHWSGKRKIYRGGNWRFSAISVDILPRANRAARFIEQLGHAALGTQEQPVYKLIHLLSPHGPWTSNKDCEVAEALQWAGAGYLQSRCIMQSVAIFLEALKRTAVFDNSLIIVQGDHGLCNPATLPSADPKTGAGKKAQNLPHCIGNSNPLLMIKVPQSTQALSISAASAQLMDLPATILGELNLEHSFPGIDLFSPQAKSPRTRTYFRFHPNRVEAAKLDGFDRVERYEISGSIFDMASWRKTAANQAKTN